MAPTETQTAANGLLFETLSGGPEGGETVVLLHGYPQSAAMWTATIAWLAARGYRSLAPNLRGYSPGANPPEARSYAMPALINDVLGIADAHGVGRFHLVGHDWGGALAWAVAASHPERLLSVTSVSTPHGAALLEAMRSSTQLLRSSYMAFFRLPRVPEAVLGAANFAQLGLGVRLMGLPSKAWERDRRQLERVGLRGPLNWYRGAVTGQRPRPVTVPTLFVWGRHDPALGRRAAELTADHVTGPYRFEEIDAGHWIPDRNAPELHRLLGDHLAANRGSAEPGAGAASPVRATRGRAAKPPGRTQAVTPPRKRASRPPKGG